MPSAVIAEVCQGKIGFVPSPDEVSRKAYFSFVNGGSVPGYDVQHWLAAEVELIAEHNLPKSSKSHKLDDNFSRSGNARVDHGTSQMKKPHNAQTLFRNCALL